MCMKVWTMEALNLGGAISRTTFPQEKELTGSSGDRKAPSILWTILPLGPAGPMGFLVLVNRVSDRHEPTGSPGNIARVAEKPPRWMCRLQGKVWCSLLD